MKKKTKKVTKAGPQSQEDKSQTKPIDPTTVEQIALLAIQKVFIDKYKYTNFDLEQNMDLIWSGAYHWATRTKNNLEPIQDPTEVRVQVLQDTGISHKQVGFSLTKSMFTVYTKKSQEIVQTGDSLTTMEDYLLSAVSENLPCACLKLYYAIGEICAGGNKTDYVSQYLPEDMKHRRDDSSVGHNKKRSPKKKAIGTARNKNNPKP